MLIFGGVTVFVILLQRAVRFPVMQTMLVVLLLFQRYGTLKPAEHFSVILGNFEAITPSASTEVPVGQTYRRFVQFRSR